MKEKINDISSLSLKYASDESWFDDFDDVASSAAAAENATASGDSQVTAADASPASQSAPAPVQIPVQNPDAGNQPSFWKDFNNRTTKRTGWDWWDDLDGSERAGIGAAAGAASSLLSSHNSNSYLASAINGALPYRWLGIGSVLRRAPKQDKFGSELFASPVNDSAVVGKQYSMDPSEPWKFTTGRNGVAAKETTQPNAYSTKDKLTEYALHPVKNVVRAFKHGRNIADLVGENTIGRAVRGVADAAKFVAAAPAGTLDYLHDRKLRRTRDALTRVGNAFNSSQGEFINDVVPAVHELLSTEAITPEEAKKRDAFYRQVEGAEPTPENERKRARSAKRNRKLLESEVDTWRKHVKAVEARQALFVAQSEVARLLDGSGIRTPEDLAALKDSDKEAYKNIMKAVKAERAANKAVRKAERVSDKKFRKATSAKARRAGERVNVVDRSTGRNLTDGQMAALERILQIKPDLDLIRAGLSVASEPGVSGSTKHLATPVDDIVAGVRPATGVPPEDVAAETARLRRIRGDQFESLADFVYPGAAEGVVSPVEPGRTARWQGERMLKAFPLSHELETTPSGEKIVTEKSVPQDARVKANLEERAKRIRDIAKAVSEVTTDNPRGTVNDSLYGHILSRLSGSEGNLHVDSDVAAGSKTGRPVDDVVTRAQQAHRAKGEDIYREALAIERRNGIPQEKGEARNRALRDLKANNRAEYDALVKAHRAASGRVRTPQPVGPRLASEKPKNVNYERGQSPWGHAGAGAAGGAVAAYGLPALVGSVVGLGRDVAGHPLHEYYSADTSGITDEQLADAIAAVEADDSKKKDIEDAVVERLLQLAPDDLSSVSDRDLLGLALSDVTADSNDDKPSDTVDERIKRLLLQRQTK